MALIINKGKWLLVAFLPLCKVKEYCYTDQQRQAFLDKYAGGVEDGKSVHTQRYNTTCT